MKPGSLALILAGVLLNAVAQLFLKAGAGAISNLPLQFSSTAVMVGRLARNGPILAGLGCYAISVVVWIMALSRVDVSVAYPMLSLGYVVNALGAWWLFGENVTALRAGAILVIVLGTWLLARS